VFAKFLKLELCLLLLGVLAGIGWFVLSTLFTPWDYVGKVPGIPTELFYRSHDYIKPIYVRTLSDQTFSCDRVAQTCILAVPDSDLPFEAYESDSLTPLPPGTVITSLVGKDGGYEWIYKRHIIALDDGSIWTWVEGAFDDLAPYVCGFIGAAMGVVFGLMFYTFWVIFRPRPRTKIKNDAKHS
jgi:hypothetical protein